MLSSVQKLKFRSFFLFNFIFILFFSSYAQEGSPFITNYELKNQYKFHNWSIIQDNDQLMLFANQKGVLSFNGSSWNMINTPSMPLTLYNDTASKRTYIGCVNDIGFLERDTTGTYNFHSIKRVNDFIGEIKEVSSTSDRIIAMSENFITIFDIRNNKFIRQLPNKSNKSPLKNLIKLNEDVFCVTTDNQFFKLVNDSLIEQKIKNKNNIGEILFDIPLSNKRSIIGTTNNRLFFFGGKSVWQFNIQDQKYLDESILLDALIVDDSKIVISTLIGGIVIIDINTRKTVKTVNYSSGLPDNEIHAIGKDINDGLWLSHQLGISRIDFTIPVKFFNTYPGSEGRLLSVLNLKNTVYVGTSESVYYLEELDEYRRARLMESQITTISKDIKKKKEEQAAKEAKKTRFQKAFQKKFKKFVATEDEIGMSESRKKALIRNRKKLGMQSISHTYRKIEGIDDRCKILVPFQNSLLVGGNNGLYEIFEKEAQKLISDIYVNNIIPDISNSNLFYICTNNGLILTKFKDEEEEWETSEIEQLLGENIFSLVCNDTSLWIGTNENVFLLDTINSTFKTYNIENIYDEPVILQSYNNNLFAFLPSKILFFDAVKDSMITIISKELNFLKPNNNALWVYDKETWHSLVEPENYNKDITMYLRLLGNIENIYIDRKNNTWVIDDKNNLYKINHLKENLYNPMLKIFFRSIENQEGLRYSLEKFFLDPDENYLHVNLSAPFYLKQNAAQYQYYLEGLMKKWSEWSNESNFSFPYIPYGDYTLHVKAKNILGKVSEEKTISFSIREPFWEKDWFLISASITLLLIIILIIRLRERKLQKNQRILEEKIKERTKTIEEQRNQIQKSHKNIQDSIVYAKRIQRAIMPSKDLMDKSFDDYFVFFKPRDIVSGDFFWLKQIGDFTVYAVADCTGHGVPGALLSMLGVSFLSEIVTKTRFDTPDEILNRLRKKVKSSLKQNKKDSLESKDGMDIALCVIDHESLQLQFAGAYNPAYILRNEELIEIKATRNPIGIYIKETPFKNNIYQLQKGDVIYTFSDGFPDQFGDNKTHKFNKNNFKKLLIKIHNKPMSEQKEVLGDILKKWRGSTDQTDDIIVIGVRV